MPSTPVSRIRCPHMDCPTHGQLGKGNIALHGFFRLKQGGMTALRRLSATISSPSMVCRRRVDIDAVSGA